MMSRSRALGGLGSGPLCVGVFSAGWFSTVWFSAVDTLLVSHVGCRWSVGLLVGGWDFPTGLGFC